MDRRRLKLSLNIPTQTKELLPTRDRLKSSEFCLNELLCRLQSKLSRCRCEC